MKSFTTSAFVILTLTILTVNSTGIQNSAWVSSGLAVGSRGLSDVAQSSVAAAAASILDSVNAASYGIVATVNAAALKATADVQKAATKEKADVDAALVAIKNGLLKIEGCIEIADSAAESAKALTSNTKTKLIAAIEAGLEKILSDVKVGVDDLHVILDVSKEKTVNDARDGTILKRKVIEEAINTLALNMRRIAYEGIGYNAVTASGAAVNDVLASRAAVKGNNVYTGRKIAAVRGVPLGASIAAAS